MLERIVSVVSEREFIYIVGALLVVYLLERIITYCRLASISKFLKKIYKRVEIKDKEKELEPRRRQNTYNRRREKEREIEELPEIMEVEPELALASEDDKVIESMIKEFFA